jgi:uncharacterized protein (TIGR02145 family)
MAKNLAYLPAVSPSAEGSETDSYYYVYGYEDSNLSAARETTNYGTYGVLYNWPAAMTACPLGWHLPGDTEWTTLTDFLGSGAGGLMKEAGTAHWSNPNFGASNNSGFTALPGGLCANGGGFGGLGESARFWSSAVDGLLAWYWHLNNSSDNVGGLIVHRSISFSVRCLKD